MSDKSNNTNSTINLSAEIGTEMQVEISSLNSRFKLTLIGLVPNKYLIYQLPEKIAPKATSETLKLSSAVNIRCISRGSVFGFHSSIIGSIRSPDTLLFLKYPLKIQQHTIRKNQRVKCLLPAQILQNSFNLAGVIADLSRSGCNFQAKTEGLTEEKKKLSQEGENIIFELNLPVTDGKREVPATIKNTFIDNEKVQIGIEFNKVDDVTLQLLDDFIAMSFDLSPF